MSNQPWFVLVGGINGSGKSTFAQSSDTISALVDVDGREIQIINPDLVTQEIRKANPSMELSAANKAAADQCEVLVDTFIKRAEHSFVIETVLSTDKYEQRVLRARRAGFQVLFLYTLLESVEQSIERVRLRVSRGGHDVPEKKIRERWTKSRERLPKYFNLATRSFVFANIGKVPQLLADGDGEFVRFHRAPPKSLAPVLKHLRPAWLHGA